MKEIQLSRGEVTLVDDDVFEWASKFKWHAHKVGNTFYAKGGKSYNLYLHREIIKPRNGREVDHIDGNGLNNCRTNLRAATKQQNLCNQKLSLRNTSGFKGVSRSERRRRKTPWTAELTVKGEKIWLGRFASKIEAARAYDVAAIKYFGEFARLNFPA